MSDYNNRDRGGRDSGRDRGGRDDNSRDSGRDRGGRDSGRDDSRGGRDSGRDGGRDRGGRDSGRSGGGSGSSAGFQYKARDRSSVEKRQQQSSQEYDRILKDGVKMFTPADGDNCIRILPPTWPDYEHYGLDIYVHYGVGPDRASYLDLFKMKGEPDPITEEQSVLRRENAHEDDIKALDSRKRVLVYIVDRNNESEGVQAYAMPWGMDKDISVLSQEKSTGAILNIDDPEEGYDVEFRRTGTGLKTKYSAFSIARRSSPLGRAEWLDYAIDNPLPEQLQYFSYDEINKVFSGGGAHREPERGGRESSREERGGRDDSRRDEGRDRDRGNRDDPPARDGDRERGRGRDDQRSSGNDRDRSRSEQTLSWEDIHAMTSAELDALVADDDRLKDIKPNDAASDEELAGWICDDLKLTKAEVGRGRRAVGDAPKDDGADKLRQMREERGGRR